MTTTPPGPDADAPVPSHPDNPAPAAPPRSRRRLVVILASAGVLVAAAIGVVVWIVAGSSEESGPRAAVQEYIDSSLAGDCAGVDAVTTDAFFTADDGGCRIVESTARSFAVLGVEMEVRDVVTVSETSAEVEMAAWSSRADASSTSFSVIKVDGSWQIDRTVSAWGE